MRKNTGVSLGRGGPAPSEMGDGGGGRVDGSNVKGEQKP